MLLKEKSEEKLFPVVKWAGGKEQELKYILPNLPEKISRFIEPFVGGGAVYFSIKSSKKLINDKSDELISLYKNIKFNNLEFVSKLQSLYDCWCQLEGFLEKNIKFFSDVYFEYKKNKIDKKILSEKIRLFLDKKETDLKSILNVDLCNDYFIFEKELLRNIKSKFVRMKDLEIKKGVLSEEDLFGNFECALKGSFYMFIRTLYNFNKTDNIQYFYFIREYCYSSMFRYNLEGNFNVPYGGISYNRKNLQRKIDYIKSQNLQQHFEKTDIYNLDFEEFFEEIQLKENDFIFLDPPYDSDFSSYANNEFCEMDQKRLANYLINKCPSKFLLIIKNTEFIKSLYPEGMLCKNGNVIKLTSFEKKYLVSFKNRNDKNVEHLLITNY